MYEQPPPRPRLLLLAYYCNPRYGSEPAAGWNRAVESAKHFDTWVISHGDNARDIEEFVRTNGQPPGLHFEFVHSSEWERRLLDTRWLHWLIVRRWHRRALQAATRLHEENHFDLVHQVTPASYREPGYLWKLDLPFVWGPVGGAHNLPWQFLLEAGPVRAASEAMRNLVNAAQLRWSRRVKHAARHAEVLLVANSTTRELFQRVVDKTATMTCDAGIRQVAQTPREPRMDAGPLRVLWSGDLEPRKALSLLLKALAQLPTDVDFELRVLGEGRMERRLRALARQLGIDARIAWLGRLPHREAVEQCGWADVFAFTSLRDTTGTVVLEALANGLPVVCLDHQGVHDIVTEHCGIKVPVTNRHQVVRDLADAFTQLSRDSQQRVAMGEAAIDRARDYLWSQLGSEMLDVYRQVLAQSKTKHGGEERSDLSARRETPDVTSGERRRSSAKVALKSAMQPLAVMARAIRHLASGCGPAGADRTASHAGEAQSQ